MSREDDRHAEREARRAADEPGAAAETAAPEHTRTKPTQFLREVRSELRKVAWPNRKELTSYTIVVLVTATVLTLLVWGFDEVIRNAVINTLG